jgi:hypothetical protein
MYFSQIDQPVIDRKKKQTLQRHKDMVPQAKPHFKAPQFTVKEKRQGSGHKTIQNRDHGINAAQLKFNRQPGRAPYDHGRYI